MRTHFLNRLDIPGKQLATDLVPEFDFYYLRFAIKISLKKREPIAEAPCDMWLTAVYQDKGQNRFEMDLKFTEVHQVKIPESAPYFWLNELEIEDVGTRQLEGINYIAKCHGDSGFEVSCQRIEILSCSPVSL